MPIKVLSASAGSGKTYNLSMFFIKLAMEHLDNYEKILAITFTNAAVNEMKNRILNRLYDLSQGRGIDDYRSYALVSKDISDKAIAQRAGDVLNRMVHHYYNFSVSTIDSFLQRLFKGALYEIGIRTNYELIVNNDEVIEQAVNDFLLNLDDNQPAFKWLVKFIKNNAQDNKTLNYGKQLIQLTQEINKEFFYPFEKDFASLSEQDYNKLEEILKKRINSFIEKAKTFQRRFSEFCEKTGLTENDFYYKSIGPASYLGSKLKKFMNEKGSINAFNLSNKYLNEALAEGKWVAKNLEQKFNPYRDSFQNLLVEFIDFLKMDGKQYEDSRIILNQLFNISILNQIIQNLHEYKKTNNIVLLSDIGKMLQEFITDNYLFIYEKLGVRYEYFLIDEFQDTSKIQYQILKPLIENSIAEKNDESTLLVGDIKQAIYRWRNGDWKLMNETIHKNFGKSIHLQALENNWRSYPYVIDFNNAVFKNLINLNNLYKNDSKGDLDNASLLTLVQNIYKDVEQKFPLSKKINDFKGYIKLIVKKSKPSEQFEDEKNNDNTENNDLKWVADEVSRLWNAGYKNIGIIVRRNIEASVIFDYLMNSVKINDDDFKVISKESITYINSNAVMWIIFTLHYLQNESAYALYMAKAFFYKLIPTINSDEYYSLLFQNNAFKAKNLYFKAEYLVNSQYSNLIDREKTFCIHFLQLLKKYIDANLVSEAMFIQWFFDKGINESIKISGEKKGVHLVTIHKSKGLEYDAVIIPSVNWSKNLGSDYVWFNTPSWIRESTIPAFLIKSKKEELLNSSFADEYLQEQNNKKIDDINLLYVAFTRAKKIIIAGVEQKEIGKELYKLLESNFKVEGLNNGIIPKLNENEKYSIGITDCKVNTNISVFTNIQYNSFKTKDDEEVSVYEMGKWKNNDEQYEENEFEHFDITPTTKPINLNIVIKDNNEWSSQKNIAHGLLIHAIMEQITDLTSWKTIAQKVMTTFNMADDDKISIVEKIEKIFEKYPEIQNWFVNADKIISEKKIICRGKVYRPDKVFIHKEKVILVDFKTGETDMENYINQMNKYKTLLKELKYSNIESYLLNIDTHELLLIN